MPPAFVEPITQAEMRKWTASLISRPDAHSKAEGGPDLEMSMMHSPSATSCQFLEQKRPWSLFHSQTHLICEGDGD